jgi:hypothetical protein
MIAVLSQLRNFGVLPPFYQPFSEHSGLAMLVSYLYFLLERFLPCRNEAKG